MVKKRESFGNAPTVMMINRQQLQQQSAASMVVWLQCIHGLSESGDNGIALQWCQL